MNFSKIGARETQQLRNPKHYSHDSMFGTVWDCALSSRDLIRSLRVSLRRRLGRVECPLPLIYRRKLSNRLRPSLVTADRMAYDRFWHISDLTRRSHAFGI